MNAQGRVTLPAEVRRRLHLGNGDQLEVAVEEDRITLRPTRVLVAEDAWAYTTENLAGIRRALDDVREGRVFQVSYEELDRTVATGSLPRRLRQPVPRKRT